MKTKDGYIRTDIEVESEQRQVELRHAINMAIGNVIKKHPKLTYVETIKVLAQIQGKEASILLGELQKDEYKAQQKKSSKKSRKKS